MLGTQISFEDVEAVDPDYYKNLKWMLENDITVRDAVMGCAPH